MSEETTKGAEAEPALRSLADKVNWLIDTARPAGRGPYTNAEVAGLIERTTGERVSYTTIWKLRNGQAANPQMKLVEAMARTFGVPPGFFFDDFDDGQAGLLHEQAELLALVRNARVSSAQLRVILEWSPEIRRAVIHLISTLTAQCEAQRRCAEGGALAQQQTPDKGAVTHSLLALFIWARIDDQRQRSFVTGYPGRPPGFQDHEDIRGSMPACRRQRLADAARRRSPDGYHGT